MFVSPNIISATVIKANETPNTSIVHKIGVVYDVILDENHEFIQNFPDKSTSYVGAVIFKYNNDFVSGVSDLSIAYPFDKNYKSLPIKNEPIEIYSSGNGMILYRRIGIESTPNSNNSDTQFESTNIPSPNGTSNLYSEISKTGISDTELSNNVKLNTFGKYFNPTNINKLKLYEGDLLIESRFGQSIRFSGYNNIDNKFSPTIIIRNKQYDEQDKTISIEEDVNRDGSSIVLSSNDYELKFKPGTIGKTGTGNLRSRPLSFQNYPDKLVGDQILINSGRLVLSSKSGEMIFYSKKNYGFISDGTFSIDNVGGIEASVGNDINILTNDNNFAIHSGNGSIFLGNTGLEPIVKGQQLVNILAELIDAIAEQQYLTPSGPTKIGPENIPTFSSIKTKLNTILSKLNQTS